MRDEYPGLNGPTPVSVDLYAVVALGLGECRSRADARFSALVESCTGGGERARDEQFLWEMHEGFAEALRSFNSCRCESRNLSQPYAAWRPDAFAKLFVH
jgi:hypothetical protein